MPDSLGWRRHPVILNYGVPVLSVGVVLALTHWLNFYLHAAPASLFICAVAVSAWLGGLMPGLLATVLSILAFKYYFVPPIHSLVPQTAEEKRRFRDAQRRRTVRLRECTGAVLRSGVCRRWRSGACRAR